MKKIPYALMFLFVFCFFNFYSNAQSPCSAVSVEVIESSSQSGQFKNWGIRVFIAQPYYDDITVEGTIEGGFAELWTLTIPAGNTSAQTSDNYYQTDPVTTAVATITSVSACPGMQSVQLIFNSIDYTTLQSLVNSDDEQGVENFLMPTANQIADYVLSNYGEDISAEVSDFPEAVIMLGFLIYAKENNFPLPIYSNSIAKHLIPFPSAAVMLNSIIFLKEKRILNYENKELENIGFNPYSCFTAALSDIVGLSTINDIYLDFKNGASARSVLGAIKAIGKRTLLGVTVGLAILSLGDCLDWW